MIVPLSVHQPPVVAGSEIAIEVVTVLSSVIALSRLEVVVAQQSAPSVVVLILSVDQAVLNIPHGSLLHGLEIPGGGTLRIVGLVLGQDGAGDELGLVVLLVVVLVGSGPLVRVVRGDMVVVHLCPGRHWWLSRRTLNEAKVRDGHNVMGTTP